jgi:hypothetical protein
MRLLGRLAVATSVSALAGLGLVFAGATTAHAQANTCTGNNVIDQAPYSCTETRVIDGRTFTINLNIDATGQAVVDFTMSPVDTQADVPIAVHSYTDISADPRQFINGVIPANQTTAQIVVPRIECGQLDIKAVFTTPGDSTGNIAGPEVTWGDVCQVPTTTTTPTTTPSSVSPSSVSPTIPPTGANGLVEAWRWALPLLGLAAIMIVVARRRPAAG